MADASPLWSSTQPQTAKNAAISGDHDDGCEQQGERGGDPPGRLRVGDDVLEPQREQRVRAADLGVGAVGLLEHTQGAQLAVDTGSRRPRSDTWRPIGGPHGLRHLCRGAPAVDLLEHGVEQRGQLDRLAVATPHEGRSDPVAGAGHHPSSCTPSARTGTLAVGLFARGDFGIPTSTGADNANPVTGLFYGGGTGQLVAQVIGNISCHRVRRRPRADR